LTGFLAQGGITTVSLHDLGIKIVNGPATKSYGLEGYQEIKGDCHAGYTVAGESVTISNRRCSTASKDEMILSAPFRAAFGFLSPHEPLLSMELKGKDQALPVPQVKR